MRELPEYLQPLEYITRPLPEAAVQTAIERREESIPYLLDSLAWVTDHPEEAEELGAEYMLHIYALYLLAQFRETRALPSILRLFRLPQYEELTGAVATESLDRILASTCGNDPAPIRELVEDQQADEWVRGAAVQAIAILSECGVISRAELSKYFVQLFAGRLDRETGNYWDRLICICTDLRMSEHLDAIRELYRTGIADPMYISIRSVEKEIARAPELPEHRQQRFSMLDDTVGEIGWWHCFEPQYAKRQSEARELRVQTAEPVPLQEVSPRGPVTPVVREAPKIGRNDSCPCGSGMKYKKCCGK